MSEQTIAPEQALDRRLETSLRRAAERAERVAALDRGTVVLHLQGQRGATVHVGRRGNRTEIQRATPSDRPDRTLFEITGDAEVVQAILDGERDAVRQFLDGGLRISGDLRAFSDVALELGLIEQPL